MIRAVLGANVFVSAVLKPAGVPGRILDLVKQKKFVLLVSAETLDELGRVLAYPKLKKLHGLTSAEIKHFVREIFKKTQPVRVTLTVEEIKVDPSDNIYLACAVEGRADYIVSGDRHLKDLGQFQGIPIVEPATFLQVIEEADEK